MRDSQLTWSAEQVRFSEEARREARGALYYTRMLEPGYEDAWASMLLGEVRRHLATVAIPDPDDCCKLDGGTNETQCGFVGVKRTYVELRETWLALRSLAADTELKEADRIRQIEDRLESFIKDTVPASRFLALTYVRIPALLHVVSEHAGLLIGTAMALGLAFGLEAVSSLYLNNPAWSLMLVVVVMAGPVLLYVVARFSRSRGKTPWYDLGGGVYREAWPHCLQPAPWRNRHPTPGATTKVLNGRLLALGLRVVYWLVMGGALAVVVRLGASDIRLTVYIITVILAGLMALGSAVDFADIHAQPPVRRSLLIVFGLYLLATVSLRWDYAGLVVILVLLAGLFWWLYKVRYLRQIAFVYSVIALAVVVVMGSTAMRRQRSAWSAVSDTLSTHWSADSAIGVDLWPAGSGREDLSPVVVIAASGGGSRAAIYTAMTLEELRDSLPEVSANIQAIGSVSGGSLASAAYIARRIKQPSDTGGRCGTSLVDRVSADFLRPVLGGVFLNLSGRGEAIQSYWEKCPGLAGLRMSDLARAWRERISAGDSLPPFPIPLMHSASLQRHAVVISPITREAYGVSDIDAEARGELNRYSRAESAGLPTWVYYRSGVYGLPDLIPGFDATLSQAVRASANFPFGFPLVDVRTKQAQYFSPWGDERSGKQRHTVRLTDGGALSNSGLWSLYHLLKNRADTLRKRGVLLIIVDAGAMPEAERPNRVLGLVSAILDKNPKGEFLHRTMLASLATTFGQCFDAVELEIRPVRDWNVYTTWALDHGSIRKLRDAFRAEWNDEGEGKAIGTKFAELATCNPARPSRWIGTSRVPLS